MYVCMYIYTLDKGYRTKNHPISACLRTIYLLTLAPLLPSATCLGGELAQLI